MRLGRNLANEFPARVVYDNINVAGRYFNYGRAALITLVVLPPGER